MTTSSKNIRYQAEFKQNDLADLFNNKISSLVVRGYFSTESARVAFDWLRQNTTPVPWSVGQRGETLTDMSYCLGLPRQVAIQDPRKTGRYHEEAESFLGSLQRAFSSDQTPAHRLFYDISGDQSRFPPITEFKGRPGAKGIVRYMANAAGVKRMDYCHVDSVASQKLLSANLYVSTPQDGGELAIWTLPADERELSNHWFSLIARHAYDPDTQKAIHALLPKPDIINMGPGDLVIFDTSQPHSVYPISGGARFSIQTFIEERHGSYVIMS